jgi:hypothetical protein
MIGQRKERPIFVHSLIRANLTRASRNPSNDNPENPTLVPFGYLCFLLFKSSLLASVALSEPRTRMADICSLSDSSQPHARKQESIQRQPRKPNLSPLCYLCFLLFKSSLLASVALGEPRTRMADICSLSDSSQPHAGKQESIQRQPRKPNPGPLCYLCFLLFKSSLLASVALSEPEDEND